MYVHVQCMCVYVYLSQCLIPRISTSLDGCKEDIKLLHEKPYRVSWKADVTSIKVRFICSFLLLRLVHNIALAL